MSYFLAFSNFQSPAFLGSWPLPQFPISFLSVSLSRDPVITSDLLDNQGFPGSSDGKESTCNVGHLGSISGLGRSPEEGHGNPFQYSCLENPMERGAWRATVHGVAKSLT